VHFCFYSKAKSKQLLYFLMLRNYDTHSYWYGRSQVQGEPLPAVAVTDVAVSSAPVAATPNKSEPSGKGKCMYLHLLAVVSLECVLVVHAARLVECARGHECNTYIGCAYILCGHHFHKYTSAVYDMHLLHSAVTDAASINICLPLLITGTTVLYLTSYRRHSSC
jgi:hypothetical protein